jgi:hypothetical protein
MSALAVLPVTAVVACARRKRGLVGFVGGAASQLQLGLEELGWWILWSCMLNRTASQRGKKGCCWFVLTIEREKETTPCDGENQIGEREQEACCFLRWMGACLLVDLSAIASREREWISARVCC